ncbi:hypothetical protein HJC10_27670 [Corallococcus exiguus]|uniref:RCC1 domain-containing protein n=1 Tax=Corallococcus exiguus TaxID=83462 RepID=UPI00147124B4|nr:hypothetical protein [Corallococcus exiguus]NNB89617.1 hypothetical protein [Corallococcus exiguus]NNC06615.1 hypothetical protein [Corallococcus exiguus]
MSAVRGAGRNGFVLGLVLCLGWLSGCAGPVAPAPAEEAADPVVARAAVTAPTWTVVGAGRLHSLGLQADGAVWAWGRNRYGQLGNNTTTDRLAPVKVTGLTGVVVDIAAGNEHSLAVKSDGAVWTWGSNGLGQLGDGLSSNWPPRTTPGLVPGLGDVTSVAAGNSHGVALKTDGTVWAWGDNYRGQLGDGSGSMGRSPVQALGFTGGTAISAGSAHTIALQSDGTVWAWGYNGNGQLGDGFTDDQLAPAQVPGIIDATAIAAGTYHSFARRASGAVWAWGLNGEGQLGTGNAGYRVVPYQVSPTP